MSLAKDIQDRVAADANLEYARDGYRLSLNPIEDRHTEIGFILWRDADGAPAPIASGRAIGDDLVVDQGSAYDGDLEALLARLLETDPTAVAPRSANEPAIPTST